MNSRIKIAKNPRTSYITANKAAGTIVSNVNGDILELVGLMVGPAKKT